MVLCIAVRFGCISNQMRAEKGLNMMITTKQNALRAQIDLKQFFEASIGALQDEGKASKTGDQAKGRNRPLRTQVGGYPARRAVADAARALTAMWRLEASKRTI